MIAFIKKRGKIMFLHKDRHILQELSYKSMNLKINVREGKENWGGGKTGLLRVNKN